MKNFLAFLLAITLAVPAFAQKPPINAVAGPTPSKAFGSIITDPFGSPSTGDRVLFATPANNGVLVTSPSGMPSISTTLPNNLAIGTPTLSGNTTVLSGSFGLSGNISSSAWTTNGVRYTNVPSTLTDTTSSGTVTAAYTNVFGANTIAASSATTFTDYFNTYFKNPIAGSNVTLTNNWALGADSLKIGLAGSNSSLAVAVGGVNTGLYKGNVVWNGKTPTTNDSLCFGNLADQVASSVTSNYGAGPVCFAGNRGSLLFGQSTQWWASQDSINTYSQSSLTGGKLAGSIYNIQVTQSNGSTEPQVLVYKARGDFSNPTGQTAVFTGAIVGVTGVLTVSNVYADTGPIPTTNSWINFGVPIPLATDYPKITAQLTGTGGAPCPDVTCNGTTGTYQTNWNTLGGTDVASTTMISGGSFHAPLALDNGYISQSNAYDGVANIGCCYNVLGNISMSAGSLPHIAVATGSIDVTTGLMHITAMISGNIFAGHVIVQGDGGGWRNPIVMGQVTGSDGATCPANTCDGTTGTYNTTETQAVASTTLTFGNLTDGNFSVAITPTPKSSTVANGSITFPQVKPTITLFGNGQFRNTGEIRSQPTTGAPLFSLISSDGSLPNVNIENAKIPGVNSEEVGEITWSAFSTAGAGHLRITGWTQNELTTATDGAEYATTWQATITNGVLTKQLYLGSGTQGGVGVGTGTQIGTGYLNVANGYYLNGVNFYSGAGVLNIRNAGAPTFTSLNTTFPGVAGNTGFYTNVQFDCSTGGPPCTGGIQATMGQITTVSNVVNDNNGKTNNASIRIAANIAGTITNQAIFGSTGTGGTLTTGGVSIGSSPVTYGAGTLAVQGIGSDATHTDTTVCQDTTTHLFLAGSGTAGICLGNSTMRTKMNIEPISQGLTQIAEVQPISYYYRPGTGHDTNRKLYGFTAEQMYGVMPELVGLDKDGRPNSVDYMGVVPVLVHAVQELKAQVDELRAHVH